MARKAARAYALVEALTAFQEASGHVEQMPDASRDRLALDLSIRQARLLTFLGRLPQALELLLQAQARAERVQEPALIGPYYAILGTTYSLMGDHRRAAQSAQQALAPARQCGDHATMGRTYYLLAMEGMWTGNYQHGVAQGQQAITCLEQANDRRWLGQAYWITGANHMFLGDFRHALTAQAQVQVIGDAIGSPRLQSYAAWTTGLTRTLMGEWAEGIVQCQRAVQQAPDPFCRTEALGFLGYAYLEQGAAAAALSTLGQAAQQMQRFRFRQLECWFTVWWGEACMLENQVARARELVLQGLAMAQDITFRVVVGWAHRTLGRLALTSGAYAEAATHLHAALDTFTAIHARAEIARTWLALAALAHAEESPQMARYLHQARTLFQAMQMPVYVARATQLATACGVRQI